MIETLRNEIDIIDTQLITLLNLRYDICLEIGKLKQMQSTKVLDSNREQRILERLKENEKYPNMVEMIWPVIMQYSRNLQASLSNN